MECAYFGVPTVVLYRTSWSTYELGKRFIKTKYLAMPNLLADKEIYPEFIQHEATPEKLSDSALRFLRDPALTSKTKADLAKVMESLGGQGASNRAAKAMLELLCCR